MKTKHLLILVKPQITYGKPSHRMPTFLYLAVLQNQKMQKEEMKKGNFSQPCLLLSPLSPTSLQSHQLRSVGFLSRVLRLVLYYVLYWVGKADLIFIVILFSHTESCVAEKINKNSYCEQEKILTRVMHFLFVVFIPLF